MSIVKALTIIPYNRCGICIGRLGKKADCTASVCHDSCVIL